jgi:hypothetical protein
MILLSVMYPIWSLKSAELGNVFAVAACLFAVGNIYNIISLCTLIVVANSLLANHKTNKLKFHENLKMIFWLVLEL